MTEPLQYENPFAVEAAAEMPALTAGVAAAQAREEQELKALFVVAHHVGRDQEKAYTELMKSCQRPGFADACEYRYPRGDAEIAGPSVTLAREAARCWKWVIYELRIVADLGDERHIRGVAMDLLSGVRVAMEDHFKKQVQRKRGGQTVWVEADERDLRELTNRRGAICVRNAILQVLPPDLIADALDMSRRYQLKRAAEDLQKNRASITKALVDTFARRGVTEEMLVEYLEGTPLSSIDPEQLCALRAVWASIRDGNSSIASHFGHGGETRSAETEKAEEALKAQRPASSTPVPQGNASSNPAPTAAGQQTTLSPEALEEKDRASVAPPAPAPEEPKAPALSPDPSASFRETAGAITDKKELIEACEQFEGRLKWVGKTAINWRTQHAGSPILQRCEVGKLQGYLVLLMMKADAEGQR